MQMQRSKWSCTFDVLRDVYQRNLRKAILAAIVLSVSLLASVHGKAQLSSASVSGTVTDSTGAVIPDAKVTIRQTATNMVRTTSTNSAGSYVFVNLNPGSYAIEVTKTGFSTVFLNAVTISVDQTARFDFSLKVGTEVQTVSVSTAAAQIETTTSNIGTVIGSTDVNALPLNGRNFTSLLTLTPGTTGVNTTQNKNGLDTITVGATQFPSVAGQWNRSNLFLMDGIMDNMIQFSEYAVQPIVDAIQEFKMQSHNDQSQFGGVMGGVVNIVTKSGTNQFHGNAWEYIRNDVFDAQDRFSGKGGLRQNVFGGTISGPVVLPRYSGRNKTFFFGAYEGSIIHKLGGNTYTVPTPEQLKGDFSNLLASGITLYDPFSTRPDPAKPGHYLRDKFPNNDISSRLDPKMVKFAQDIFPAPIYNPNSPTLNGLNKQPASTTQNNYSIRMDHQFNLSNTIWGRYSRTQASQIKAGAWVGLRGDETNDAQNWGLNYTHIFGASATLSVQAGHAYAMYNNVSQMPNKPASTIDDAGFNKNYVCNFIGPLPCAIPVLVIPGYINSGGEQSIAIGGTNVYQFKADYTRLMGNHTIGIGADVTPYSTNLVNQATPDLGFAALQTANLNATNGATGSTGDALASMLLGVPNTAERRNLMKRIGGQSISSFYFQDQWKLTPKLTLNWGVRYDLLVQAMLQDSPTKSNYTGAYDLRPGHGEYILTKTASTAPLCSNSPQSPCFPSSTLPDHVIVSPSDKLIGNSYDNFQPRLGLSYQIHLGTVLHLSYARVYDTWSWTTQSVQNEGALWPSVGLQLVSNLNTITVSRSAEDPLNLGTATAVLPAATPFGQSAYFVAPYLKNPYSDQWLFGIQQQIGNNSVFGLNYVGSRTTRLPCCNYYNTATTPGSTPVSARNPFPYITPTRYAQSNGSANYHSLQAQLQRRFTGGFSYALNYTWSKTIDVGCDGTLSLEGCFVRDPYNLKLDRSVAGFDVPHIFTGTLLYQLPFGTGQRFQSSSRVVNQVAGGWQINAIESIRSGVPYMVIYNGDLANTGNINQTVDLIGDPHLSNPTLSRWFNTAAYQAPAAFTSSGNNPRNSLRSQWYNNSDLSVFRTFTFEKVKAEFRLEAFNALNGFVAAAPNATFNAKNFGQVTTSANSPRQLQFALKLSF